MPEPRCTRREHIIQGEIKDGDDRLHYCVCRSLSVQHREGRERSVVLRESVLKMLFAEEAPDA